MLCEFKIYRNFTRYTLLDCIIRDDNFMFLAIKKRIKHLDTKVFLN